MCLYLHDMEKVVILIVTIVWLGGGHLCKLFEAAKASRPITAIIHRHLQLLLDPHPTKTRPLTPLYYLVEMSAVDDELGSKNDSDRTKYRDDGS